MNETVISLSDHGKTVFAYLRKQFPVALVHKIFRKNGLRVNGVRAKEEMILRTGDVLKFYLQLSDKKPAARADQAFSESRQSFEVLHEEEDFMVVNKHPGIAVHEGKTVSFQVSLIGQLVEAYKPKGVTPLLVHRLDTNTSGCLIVAKNEVAKAAFEEMFESGKLEKEYLTLVDGLFHEKEGKISISLPGREGKSVSALTYYEVIQGFQNPGASLVKAKIKTGRMHQIRLHFAGIHHPVLMDSLHGNFESNRVMKKKFGLKRQFLHAHRVSFEWKGKQRHFLAPLSEDLEKVLKKLRSK